MTEKVVIKTPDWDEVVKVRNETRQAQLRNVLDTYAVPDESIVGKLPRGQVQLDYVGHAEITRILITIDPDWYWEPFDIINGRPATTTQNGMVSMWGRLCIHGKELIGVGTVREDKPDLDKELVSDFLRNAAMRFGIALSLWSKAEWDDLKKADDSPQKPTKAVSKPRSEAQAKPAVTDSQAPIPQDQMEKFMAACTQAGLNPLAVFKKAGVDVRKVTLADLPAMREAFNAMKKESADASTTQD